MTFDSKLPDVGTTIFTLISRRAEELGATNLGQGFPDYNIDPRLAQLVYDAMREGFNQYAPMPGYAPLRTALAAKLARSYALQCDPEREITVTLGATEALFCAVQALAGAGDEVIVFDPAYDSYQPAAQLAGARCLHVPLQPPEFRYDWDRVRATLSARTRLIIVNSPHNPSCTRMSRQDLAQLAQIAEQRDLYVLSDEVYEHMVLDGGQHHSVLSWPELRQRSVVVYSLGKTLHATGLRVGYAVAAPRLTAELRKVHQFNTFSIAMPLQVAIARYLSVHVDVGDDLPEFFRRKRDRLIAALGGSGLRLPPAQGTFFQLADYGALSSQPDTQFAEQLLLQARVATIPLSVFYQQPPPMTLLRLCVAKKNETLDTAASQIVAYAQQASSRAAHAGGAS